MNKYQSLTIYAILIMATGIVLMSLAYYPTRAIQYLVAFGMLLSACFAFFTAFKSEKLRVSLNYHVLHGFGMLVYGFFILFYGDTMEKFLSFTTFFLLYYGMAEIIFCFQLLTMKQRNISAQIIIYRLLIGFFIAMGAVYVVATKYSDSNKALLAAGAVFLFSGVYSIVFKTVLKRGDMPPSV